MATTRSVRLREFKRVVFFTGAGMSAESGVPTYRGAGGIWKQYDYQRYACQQAFDRDPESVWEFHNFRRGIVAACEPNPGHHTIARAERLLPSVAVVTQNIDGLHQRAGSERVLELHGSLWRVRCDRCRVREAGVEVPRTRLRCEQCGGWWRPDIVWFGDYLDSSVLDLAQKFLQACDLLVSIGTSAVVHPAAVLPEIALANGALCVEINPEPTPASDLYQVHMRGPATTMLAELAEGLE
jgi:NAD-dependent deacetylase